MSLPPTESAGVSAPKPKRKRATKTARKSAVSKAATSPSPTAQEESKPAQAPLAALLEAQRTAHLAAPFPSEAVRRDRLNRAIGLLVDHERLILDALDADFGSRSREQGQFLDVATPIQALKHARDRVGRWMRPQGRPATFPFNLIGGRARLEPQPKGVVGVMSPWNFPVQLTFGPLAGILAAGNRAMIKPSEFTPAIAGLMAEMIAKAFDPREVTVVEGGPDIGAAFAALPFDHLLYTGSSRVGRLVMAAAAQNLVPVTLELGGKCPTIVGATADIEKAAERILAGKLMNAGQVCLAPDHVYVPKEHVEAFAEAASATVRKLFPTIKDNPDYVAIISPQHFERLKGLVDASRQDGLDVREINPAAEDFTDAAHRKLAPHLVLEPGPQAKVMGEEIFGPVLPILSYTHIDEVISRVASGPKPLALYYFGKDDAEETRVLRGTSSGGVTINDVMMHFAQEALPFGGVGESGMGAYHGETGFRTFSHERAIYRQSPLDVMGLMSPPYTDVFKTMMRRRISR